MVKKILIGLLIAILVLSIGGFAYYRLFIYQPPAISENDRAEINLMPLPAKLKLKNGTVNISDGLLVEYDGFKNELIEKSAKRLYDRINKGFDCDISKNDGAVLAINCLNNSLNNIQQHDEDESYLLYINRDKIRLEANSQYGIVRGLETIFQLCKKKNGQIILPELEIEDNPRFIWRGLMLDVCRHWVPKEVVLRIIDAMALVKMNVLHWHLSDDQGFRVESKVFPKLHEVGGNGKYYLQKELREVIEYATERGIRIVPEFDLPGHSKSWQIAYPELSSVEYPLSFGVKKGMAFTPPIDPTREEVYSFLDQFLEEMAALFPDPYFHVGGDEVNPKFWNESESIQKFMKENEMKDHHELQAYFIKRMNGIFKKHGKIMVGWNEILNPDLGDDIVVQSWNSHKSLFEAVQNGGTAILSAGYYLDFVLPAADHYKVDPLVLEGAIDLVPDTSFWKMYDMTMDFAGNEMNSELVIFDRDPNNVSGFFAMMENRMAFKNGVLKDNVLTCKLQGPVGEMTYDAEFEGDKVEGQISIGLLKFKSHGTISGGSKIPGTEMPKIEIMKPLTTNEESRIIGGEACQWAEFVDGDNIESRVWPRTAAIAEKLWSPKDLTTDTDDMYRRLDFVSESLTAQSSRHATQYHERLKQLIPNDGFQILCNLTDILEEVKYHGRMPDILGTENLYLPDFKLNRIVDIVRPESKEARIFNKLTEQYSTNAEEQEIKRQIIKQLKIWKNNHVQLRPFITENEIVQDVDNISKELAEVAELALISIEGKELGISDEELARKLSLLETGENGVIVAVVPGLRRIIESQ